MAYHGLCYRKIFAELNLSQLDRRGYTRAAVRPRRGRAWASPLVGSTGQSMMKARRNDAHETLITISNFPIGLMTAIS